MWKDGVEPAALDEDQIKLLTIIRVYENYPDERQRALWRLPQGGRWKFSRRKIEEGGTGWLITWMEGNEEESVWRMWRVLDYPKFYKVIAISPPGWLNYPQYPKPGEITGVKDHRYLQRLQKEELDDHKKRYSHS